MNSEQVKRLVGSALERRRTSITTAIARKLVEMLEGQAAETESLRDQWQRVESLSQLRALVGGRFQNLKERWVQAGLPLREHRGDRTGEATISEPGWEDLAAWIEKQGFESRRIQPGGSGLFEVRRLK